MNKQLSFPLGAKFRDVSISESVVTALTPKVLECTTTNCVDELRVLLNGNGIPRRYHPQFAQVVAARLSGNYRGNPASAIDIRLFDKVIDQLHEPMDNEIISLDEGVRRALSIIRISRERPVLLAIYGYPHSGKSYFMDQIKGYLSGEGIECAVMRGAAKQDTFEILTAYPSEMHSPVWLFHCAWPRDNYSPAWLFERQHEDPNILAEKVAGRLIDANIGMFNPTIYNAPRGAYDFVIKNAAARKK